MIPVTNNVPLLVIGDGTVAGMTCVGLILTAVTTELVTVPAELVALIVYTVDVAGDIALDPWALTSPIPWSMLTELAPVTFQTRFDVSPGLIVDGPLVKVPITGAVPGGGVDADGGV